MKHHTIAWLLGGLTLVGMAGAVQAQTVYRIVGADGKVTFSDKPPATPAQGKVAATGIGAAAANPSSALPLELRSVVAKYPVVLYSAAQCGPCDTGRSILTARGIPFTERTVTTVDDRAALVRLMGDDSLPVLTIGTQRLKGLTEVEWVQYLDAAGYPKTSGLPASYKSPPATPLVALQNPATGATQTAEPPKPAPSAETPYTPPPTRPSPSNPAGITF